MDWQPQDEPLRQLAGYLKDSLNGYDQEARKHAEQVSTNIVSETIVSFFWALSKSLYLDSMLADEMLLTAGVVDARTSNLLP